MKIHLQCCSLDDTLYQNTVYGNKTWNKSNHMAKKLENIPPVTSELVIVDQLNSMIKSRMYRIQFALMGLISVAYIIIYSASDNHPH